jgi:hypothetical protein
VLERKVPGGKYHMICENKFTQRTERSSARTGVLFMIIRKKWQEVRLKK